MLIDQPDLDNFSIELSCCVILGCIMLTEVFSKPDMIMKLAYNFFVVCSCFSDILYLDLMDLNVLL